jgi:lipopolysaccharide transport system permease protein
MNELIIEPGRVELNYWRDLWTYRELFYFLAWRDILVRYKQTAIGVAWAVIQPFLTTVVFTIVFNRIAKMTPPAGVPYFLVVMTAQLPWQFFSSSLSASSSSLTSNANLISKVYFPRLIVPASSVITCFVDFLITVGLVALSMLWFKFLPDWRLVALPLFVLLAFGAAFGMGLWLCALNVKYRDFRYIIPFIVQFGFFLSPVGWVSERVPSIVPWHGFDIPARLLYSLNPMVGVIDGFRWALLRGQTELWWPSLLTSVLVTCFLCFSGVRYFRKMERTFADVI